MINILPSMLETKIENTQTYPDETDTMPRQEYEGPEKHPLYIDPEVNDGSDYELLNHGWPGVANESPEMLRSRYLYLTRRLIYRACDATLEGELDEHSDPVDTMVFLDKSARPVAWMMREFWEDFAPLDEQGEQLPMPEIKFVNIDKEQWIANEDLEETEGGVLWRNRHYTPQLDEAKPSPRQQEALDELFEGKSVPEVAVASLRSIFLKGSHGDAEELDLEAIQNEPSMLDGKKILLVDEVASTGLTKKLAEGFFEQAFPSADIETHTWMNAPVREERGKSGRRQIDNPLWYDEKSSAGRGVDNRNFLESQLSLIRRVRDGALFLSRPLKGGQDALSMALRRDFKRLKRDLKKGNDETLATYTQKDLKLQWRQ